MYRTILTKVGRSKIGNFVLTQQPVLLKYFAVGDSGGTAYSPTEDQTELKNEKYRVEISKAEINQQGDINKVSVEALLASNVGGFLINEVGLFDESGDLIAVARQPERFKPLVEDGTTSEMKFIIEFYIANASSVQIKVDPSIIVITQEDLNKHNGSNKSHEDIRSSIRSHLNNQENPHGVTLEQIGAAALQHEHEYSTIINKPDTFPPSSHKHSKSEIIDFTHNHDDIYHTETEVNNLLDGKAPLSHGNHVPTLQAADNKKFLRNDNTWQVVTPANIGAAPSSHVTDKNNPHGVTKAQVGLGSVENYPVASEAEALAGVANNRYMTPYLVKRRLEELEKFYRPSATVRQTLLNSEIESNTGDVKVGAFRASRDGIVRFIVRVYPTSDSNCNIVFRSVTDPSVTASITVGGNVNHYGSASTFWDIPIGSILPFDGVPARYKVPGSDRTWQTHTIEVRVHRGQDLIVATNRVRCNLVQVCYDEVTS